MDSTLRGFANLSEAVAFLDSCFATGDSKLLDGNLLGSRTVTFDRLEALYRVKPMSARYADREFPTERARFKLGGHASELGHVHIDFSRRDQTWFLDGIWLCR